VISAWPTPAGGEECALAFDRGREARLLVLPALFDEANKLRRFTAEVMRRLDAAGIDSFLPDLPGCNESLAPLDEQTLAGWREAAEAAAVHFGATHGLSIRGGALCEPSALPALRYSPATGSSLLRAMLRARILASKEAGIAEEREALTERGRSEGIELAGYRFGPQLIRELATAEPSGGVALANIAQGDVGGAGLWLRAEPDHSPKQADALAGIVADVVTRTSTSSVRADVGSNPSPLTLSLSKGRAEPVGSEAGPKGQREGEMRRHTTFACEGETLAATLDEVHPERLLQAAGRRAPGSTGLLIVSGGNEIRCGAFAGQARLAARIAAAGHPVFRFDRRGTGDSSGENRGFRDSAPDIAAALAAFRAEAPGVERIVAFGNCDAASALMLAGGAGCDALVLANPWTIEHDDGAPPPDAIRARYAEKLRDPRELVRLATGKVSLRKLAGGLGRAMHPPPPPSSLAQDMAAALEGFAGPVRILLADRDRTAQAFLAAWDTHDARIERCAGANHAFAEPEARDWLAKRVLEALGAGGQAPPSA
jgi:exosortase A-associated hydrolase 1